MLESNRVWSVSISVPSDDVDFFAAFLLIDKLTVFNILRETVLFYHTAVIKDPFNTG
jgi:hypothetical protein